MNKTALDNYRRMRERLLDDITVKCSKCEGSMVRCIDLDSNEAYNRNSDQVIEGYSCKSCPHYYLLVNP